MSARKSLIVERTAAASLPRFATSRAAFATSQVFASAAVAPFSLLSNSLKKKKKEYVEGQEISRKAVPRVGCVLPSVKDAAYFLGHEFLRVAMPEWWQLMADEYVLNQTVTHKNDLKPSFHELRCVYPFHAGLNVRRSRCER
ncbi:hypothetical protein [Burkholderia sp. MSMB1552]|uniref:hypothetical protein n=1 Tax=Burkholderia sp. MSMB1552 TaxID=1636424 RepID=UPI0018D23BFA|nr:hypothetical protein [Burkholderia sp. MSMB1552]